MNPTTCTLDGCNGPTYGKDPLCGFHLYNLRTYGTPRPTCAAPGCTRGRRDLPYCFKHQRNLDQYGTFEKPTRLTAAPLVDYVRRHGGVGAVLTAAGYQWGTVAYDSATKRFDRVAADGSLTPALADSLAIEVLGVHPCFIWGDAWWLEVAPEELEAVAS